MCVCTQCKCYGILALKMNFDYKRAYMFYALQPQFLFLIDATVKQVNVFKEGSHRFLGSVNFHLENMSNILYINNYMSFFM